MPSSFFSTLLIKNGLRLFSLFFGLMPGMLLWACTPESEDKKKHHASHQPDIFDLPPPAERWYSPEQVKMGEKIYLQHCQSCHGDRGVGTKDWRTPLKDGSFPPPPLDGSAHAWHHPLDDLLNTVDKGLNHMPAFGDKLDEAERRAVIAYLQSLWPDGIYDLWHVRVERIRLKSSP